MDGNKNKSSELPDTTFGLIFILMIYKKAIIHCVVFAAVVSTIVVLLMPNWYKSTASIFPAEQSSPMKVLGTVSSSPKSFSRIRNSVIAGLLSKALGSIETDRYLAMLKSNRVLLSVIQRFNLRQVYDLASYPVEYSIKELLENTEFKVVWEGNIFITVYDKDPQRAADMANYFVEIINRTNSEMIVQSIQSNRQVVNNYYMNNLGNLKNVEDSLKSIQKRLGIISLQGQAQAYRKTIADYSAELSKKEIQARILKKTLSINHPYSEAVDIEIEELQKKLNDFYIGTTVSDYEMNVFTPFNSMATFSAEYARRYRDVETRYNILHNTASLYEQAKVEDQWNTPAVVVLDRAIPAERKAKPQRILILFGGIAVGFLSSLLLSVLHYNWDNEKKQNTAFYKLIIGLININH